jgi:protein tyrosine phosphatase (PTP) superfamily phosphohydrolase (DUF442 family)
MSLIYNFCQVSDTLACAGQPTEQQLKQLADENYQAIVNLSMPRTKYVLPDEAGIIASLGMDYYHIPVVFDEPRLSELSDFIDFMNRNLGKKILVHCVANNRASVFMGLYLLTTGKLTREEMQTFIEEIWQPDAIWDQFLEEGVEYIASDN